MFLLKKPRSYWRAGLECRGGGRPGSRRNKPWLPPLRGPNFYVAVGRSAGFSRSLQTIDRQTETPMLQPVVTPWFHSRFYGQGHQVSPASPWSIHLSMEPGV